MSYLLVPVSLDALCLSQPYPVAEAMADFSRLPYVDGQQVQNAATPTISDAILSDPLGQPNLVLDPGVHLHWALPDALTKGTHSGNTITFPAVPNRWLVTRRFHGKTQAQWVVESDYLYPEGMKSDSAVTIPYTPGDNEHQPFRYLGRCLTLNDWQADAGTNQYLPVLTAMGAVAEVTGLDYVKGTFAALYPSARSSFGFYDASHTDGMIPAGLEYEVVGWYRDTAQDALATWFAAQSDSDATALLAGLGSDFKWRCDLGDQAFPQQLICYGRLTFATGGALPQPEPGTMAQPGLTVANTGTEALSAYLAQALDIEHKDVLEEQLEALEFARRLGQQTLDVGPKFKEARHTKGFHRLPGGNLYAIQSKEASSPTAAGRSTQPQLATLPTALAGELDDLNRVSRASIHASHTVQGCRQQVFADWCKYLLSSYDDTPERLWPDGRSILDFIQQHDLPALNTALQQLAGLKQDVDAKVQALTQKITDHNQRQGTAFALEEASAPAFYRPNDPVVLLTGEAATPSQRHGQDGRTHPDGLLHCAWLGDDLDLPTLSEATTTAIATGLGRIDAASSEGIVTWTAQPWNPLMLAWKVEIFPDPKSDDDTPTTISADYDANIIANHYELPANSPDLDIKNAQGLSLRTNVYRGISALSSHAHGRFKQRLADYLNRELKLNAADPQRDLDQQVGDLLQQYAQQQGFTSDRQRAQDPVYTALRAYEHLIPLKGLSQTLGGLNDALLTCHQAMQLGVADPLADADTQPLIEQIRQAVGNGVGLAPYPNDFSPLRAGAMQILSLRLIDTFGQVLDLRDLNRLQVRSMVVSETMRSPSRRYPIYLRPRLAQAARLNFRWLSAADGTREVSPHPATTPVCGWLLPNNLDDSLMVYDSQGNGLGYIDDQAVWQPMPGSALAVGVSDLPNPYLQNVVTFVLNQGADFSEPFLSTLDTALAAIDPEDFATHQSLALLIGRPIAVVRALVDLEVAGSPGFDQGERAMQQAVATGQHRDGGLSDVRFPVRIGEYLQFNDGLVGYWPEDAEGHFAGNVFYAPQSRAVDHDHIRTHADGLVGLEQSIHAPAQTMTLLVDPRGSVHATCGIVPTQSLAIDPNHYAEVLRTLQAVFSTSPVLMEQGKTELPVPKQAGYTWSWVTQQNGSWSETSALSPVQLTASFSGGQALYGGWLKLSPQESAAPVAETED